MSLPKGWFAIPGVQQGDRTLAEQMKGLAPALGECEGRTVLDLGCAEGLIAIEFAKAGAIVHGFEYNQRLYDVAQQQRGELPAEVQLRLAIECCDLREWIGVAGGFLRTDIVLALAILHKLPEPRRALEYFAGLAVSLMVIRLPARSSGQFVTKYSGEGCDVNAEMPRLGFNLERVERGPRKEPVQYWRRRKK